MYAGLVRVDARADDRSAGRRHRPPWRGAPGPARRPDRLGGIRGGDSERFGQAVWSQWDWQDTRADVITENEFFGSFLAAFGVVLLLAASLVVAGVIGARVVARTRELGVLKAVGMTPRSLTALVLAEQLVLASVGVGVGFVAGGLVSPRLQLRVAQVLSPTGASFPLSTLLIAAVAVGVLVSLATVAPAWRAGRVPASQAVTRGGAPARVHLSRLGGLVARARLGAAASTGRPTRSPARSGPRWRSPRSAVTTVAVMVTLAFNGTVDRITGDPALVGDPYDVVVVPEGLSSEEIDARLEGVSGRARGSRPRHVAPRSGRTSSRPGRSAATSNAPVSSCRKGGCRRLPTRRSRGTGCSTLDERVGGTWTSGAGGVLPSRSSVATASRRTAGRSCSSRLRGSAVEPDAAPGETFVRVADGTDRSTLTDRLRAEFGDRGAA